MATLKIWTLDNENNGYWAIVEDISGVKYIEQELTEAQKAQARANIGILQADFNQNDSSASDYIKNRPCYSEMSLVTYIEEGVYTFSENEGMYMSYIPIEHFEKGATIEWDGIEYICNTETYVETGSAYYYGNLSLLDTSLSNTGEPFVIQYISLLNVGIVITQSTQDTHTIKAYKNTLVYHKLDERFIPGKLLPEQPNLSEGYIYSNGVEYSIDDTLHKTQYMYDGNVISGLGLRGVKELFINYDNDTPLDNSFGINKRVATEDFVQENVQALNDKLYRGLGATEQENSIKQIAHQVVSFESVSLSKGTQKNDLDFTYDSTTSSWNVNPVGNYYGNNDTGITILDITINSWILKGIELNNGACKQILINNDTEDEFTRITKTDNTWSEWNLKPRITYVDSDTTWENGAIFVFDKATRSFKYSGKTLESYKKEIQDEMKSYIADYIETYMSQEIVIDPDGSETLYINGPTREEKNNDGSITLLVGGN